MSNSHYDAIIVGAGQSGPALARRLAASGQQVAIVERKHFGGTCVNTGCTPTKALVASAYAAHLARRAKDYGVTIGGPVGVDMKAVKARKEAIIEASRSGVERSLRKLPGCTVYQGHARFVADKTLAVDGVRLTADRIFLNVGGRALIPRLAGLDQVPYQTNTSVLELDSVPQHLVVLGGSYVGLEFAQIFRRFGSEVSVIELAPRVIPREDDDISRAVAEILDDEGVSLYLDSKVIAVEKQGNYIAVKMASAGSTSQLLASHLLVAVGRRPNTDDLGLETTGIAVDQRGYVQVDDQLRTSVADIWALGDCNGRGAFTHTSYDDFQIVAANILDGERRSVRDRIAAYALYTDPPLGRAGLTEAEVRQSGRPALIAKLAMEDVSRAYEKGETKGFMKIIVDRDSQQILGAALLGVTADEVVHSILDLMYARAPYTVLQRAMHIHPTVSEFLPTMMEDLKPLQ
jgi:pyruvate/2-oxoglutarate dehydrogenase complex dihydrolipoamide dehydrogenase (E3) component